MDLREQHHITHLSTGDKSSLTFLFGKYHGKVYHYCLQFVRSQEIAEEITLDVFLKVWEKRSTLKTNRSLSGLLFKITRDLSISYLRKVSKDVNLRREFVANYLQTLDSPIEEALLMKEGIEMANEAIKGLPPRCKQVFQLRYSEGLSLKQIAEELNISTNTVKKQLSKGTHIIKGYLKANADLVFACILGQLL